MTKPKPNNTSPSNPHRILQDSFEAGATRACMPAALLAEHVSSRFTASGVRLKKAELAAIESACLRIQAGESVEILRSLPIRRATKKDIDLGLTETECDAILKNRMTSIISTAQGLVQTYETRYLSPFSSWSTSASKAHELKLLKFRGRIARQWRIPFQALSAFLFACGHVGEELMEELTLSEGKDQNLSSKLSALFLLHARACIVASEINTLLHGGFADGGMARWRTLHEIAVVAQFIAAQDEMIAERYLAYEDIEGHRAARLYQRYFARLGQDALEAVEIKKLDVRESALLFKYGSSFGKEYGWAATVFNGKAPNFSQIEEQVGVDHLRPYYKMASQQTHATSKGLTTRLGLLKISGRQQGRGMLLAGPTNSGYTDPAQLTSLSMLQITIGLLSENATIDRMVVSKILAAMQEKLPRLFMVVESRIEEREKLLRKRSEWVY